MAEIYEVSFYGDEIEVTVTKDSTVVNDWILQTVQTHRRRLHKLLIGLDIEWLPCFKPEENHPVALLQLCVGRRCLLFQLLHKDAVPGFLLDLNRLAFSVYGEEVYRKMGLKRMAKEVLGKVMEKPLNVTLSKWDAEELCYEQVEYGAIDAFVSFEIAKNLFNLVWEREKESRRVVKREYLNCHYQPMLRVQDTQGMFRRLALF
ncbi:uncharacterized protein LOC132066021 [Lycium ferocissimum]|uniref:uncharacterized protein LOC132066021 n=1 Tax=Lycium ferocissimum TaxID=112874 RepID=UPI0028151F87|nr:uncharacterized protein LOC132066021 [Lycium ferocissimum]